RAGDVAGQLDGLGDALDRDRAGGLDPAVLAAGELVGLEGDLGEPLRVEEVGRLEVAGQVLVGDGHARDACGAAQRGLLAADEGGVVVGEAAAEARDAGMDHLEGDGRMGGIGDPGTGGCDLLGGLDDGHFSPPGVEWYTCDVKHSSEELLSRQVLSPQASPESTELAPWVRFLRAHAALTRELNTRLVTGHGLTLNDYEVLLRLAHAPDRQMRRVDLASEVLLTASGITRLLEGLERAGYVERGQCAS